MQNPQIRRNQTWRPVLALALLAGMATPAWAIDVSNGLKAARQATDRVELAAQTTAQVSDDPQVQEMASTVAYVADNVKTGITVAETAVTGNAILTGSGATIMKTLAGAGGPVVVAGATGLTAAKVMNETLYSNCDDQAACDAAQTAASRIGELVAVHVIARPHRNVDQVMPLGRKDQAGSASD